MAQTTLFSSKNVQRFTLGVILAIILAGLGFALWQHNHRQTDALYNQPAVLFSKTQAAGPLLAKYQQQTKVALASDQPIMQLPGLSGDKAAAQEAAIHTADMQAAAHDPDTGQALRAQVFQVNPLAAADSSGKAADCSKGLRCYTVEIYFFASNKTGKLIVGLPTVNQQGKGANVLSSDLIAYSQPELPQALTDITRELIGNSQELRETVHSTVDLSKLTMVNGKTALAKTRCERSEHLCVAPTLAQKDDAYWIIVDLTDERIVGVTWTAWKDKVPDVPPSEQTVIDAAIMQKYCGVSNNYQQDGWKFSYNLTGSDGIEVTQVSYQGVPMLASVKNPDWHVSYSRQDGFGYSDAVGCPVFSTAAVVPATEPRISDMKDGSGKKLGFELIQDFKSKLWPQPCNYYYQQKFQFFNDGSFRPVSVSLGRGCGDDGTYRPNTRIQPATSFTAIQQWNGSGWQTVNNEKWDKDSLDSPLPEDTDNNRYRLTSDAAALTLSLGRGQFGDGGRGDKAWVYIDRFHTDKDEGNGDMATLGSCCNTDYHQGPDVFTNNEPLGGNPLLLWYVAEQKNDGTPGEEYCWANATVANGTYQTTTYPCPSGPKLKLTKK